MNRIARIGVGLLGMTIGAVAMRAQVVVRVWDGVSSPSPSSAFVNATNWAGNVAPDGDDIAQFGNHSGVASIVVNSTAVGHLEFLSTRTAIHNFLYTDGTATLTLNGNFTAQTGPDINFLITAHQLNLALPTGEHVFDIGGSTNVTIMGVVSGAGHLTKQGTGNLILMGSNTLSWGGTGGFNNAVAVDGGTLEIRGGSITQPGRDIIVGSVAGATGTMLVSNGGDVTDNYGVAGNDTGTNATITVTGAGSTWTNSNGMAVGYLGTGFLNVLDGGVVTTTGTGGDHSYLGLQGGTAGTAVVSGTGSSWLTPNDQLILGGSGIGNLTVSTGGLVTNTAGYIGRNAGGSGTVAIDAGTWNNSGNLAIGDSGTGTLNISNGGDVTSAIGLIGMAATGAGTVNVAGSGSTWANSSNLVVGSLGTGTLNVTAGGNASATGNVSIGAGDDSNGTANVSGAGSVLDANTLLYVGNLGTGSLTLSNGGTAYSANGSIAFGAGSVGTTLVDNGVWTNFTSLSVGGSGAGTLTVRNDGVTNVSAGSGTITLGSVGGGSGTLNIGGAAASAAEAPGIINASTITSGPGSGTLRFNTTAPVGDRFYLTKDGTGGGTAVTITGATQVVQTAGYTVLTGVNTYTGGTTIAGGYLLLGDYGTTGSITGNVNFTGHVGPGGGELQFLRSNAYLFGGNISGAGRVSNFGDGVTTLIGTNTYSGETFIDAGAIADGGAGTLSPNSVVRVNSGASLLVSFNETIAGLDDYSAGVSGSVQTTAGLTLNAAGPRTFSGVITGSGSLVKTGAATQILAGANTYGGSTLVKSGTLRLNGGSITSVASSVNVGGVSGDDGTLIVQSGGAITALSSTLGLVSGSAGSGSITGATSSWNLGNNLTVGDGGMGLLTIAGGALVTNATGTIGNLGTGDGSVTVGGTGSTWTNANYLYVGAAGEGTLDILTGGSVSALNVSIGNNASGDGQVWVDGTGSNLNVASTLYVGSEGTGQLGIFDSALVSSQTGSVGNNAGGDGFVEVADGGTWTNSGSLLVGNADSGYLDVYSGGTVTAANAVFGVLGSVDGAAWIGDSGSSFATAGNLTVGGSGIGTVDIVDGGQVTTGGNAIIGDNAASVGNVILTGSGTSWSVAGTLYVGNAGSGLLQLLQESVLNVQGGLGSIVMGHTGGVGAIDIGYDGEGFGAGPVINASSITTESGTGSLLFGTDATSADPYYLTRTGVSGGPAVTIAGTTAVLQVNGYTVLEGSSTYSGGTLISGGTLVADAANALGTGPVTLSGGRLVTASGITLNNPLSFSAGGTLGGSGAWGAPITVGSGGHLAPGDSPGVLTFTAGLSLASGGYLDFEVQSATGTAGFGYDLLSISGAPLNISATSASRFTLKVISLNSSALPGNVTDFSSANAYSWTIASSAVGITGFSADKFLIDTSLFTNPLGIGSFSLSQMGPDLVLSFTPVPEPETYMLMFGGLAAVAWNFRRKRTRR
jgi:T5SS/PEP-CTERM-associated repeat protein/autotransporter-associated beta strand protein